METFSDKLVDMKWMEARTGSGAGNKSRRSAAHGANNRIEGVSTSSALDELDAFTDDMNGFGGMY